MREAFAWLKPSPLWRPDGRDLLRLESFGPVLLEFRSDEFVDEFLAEAAAPRPDALAARVLRAPGDGKPPLKLFQAIHGRFYLVAASLSCRMPGWPARSVATGDGERVFFVLRKLIRSAEYGWTTNGAGKGWRPVTSPTGVLKEEEPLPLFPAKTADGRTIYAGYLPVASRETYAAAPALSPVDPAPPLAGMDPRLEFVRVRVVKALTSDAYKDVSAPRLEISVYAYLDLWEFFLDHLPALATALRDGGPLGGPEGQIRTTMQGLIITEFPKPPVSLADAVGLVARHRDELNDPAAGPLPSALQGLAAPTGFTFDPLEGQIGAALRPDALPPVEVGKFVSQPGERYLVRCVYRRPRCEPAQEWVSGPSPVFDLAVVFDPDAPVRPIRIGLPDVSLRSLRKFAKGVAFSMNEELQKKMQHPQIKLGGGSPSSPVGPSVHGGNVGFICSFSIPIITICAFILLMIIVNILNLVFFWLPYFTICFPLKPSVKS
jgi:hypothetical protein